ncbi:MAG: PEP-CTERM sorting domain-containing protein [Bryobacterales bacterium]|nr:PEP-CTERM sorting domain-containing protein [Bryobacterales bacterium]
MAYVQCWLRLVSIVCLAILAVGSANAGLLLDIARGDESFANASLSETNVRAISWNQTVESRNVSISAYLRDNLGGDLLGNAYITTSIGIGTTTDSVVASSTFSAPFLNPVSTPVTIFTGLDLSPGTYYLVLQGPAGPFANNFSWYASQVTDVFAATGFSLGSNFFSLNTSADTTFAPASEFTAITIDLNYLIRIESVEIPEPGTAILLCVGLFGLGWLQRRSRLQSRENLG